MPGACVGPWSTSWCRPSAYIFPSTGKPKSLINFHETYCKPPPSSTWDREGLEALPGTLPKRGIIAGGLLHHHAYLRSDAWVVYWWLVSKAHWEPQEEGMMSTAASLPSVMKPRFNQTSRRKPNFRRWCLLALWHSRQGHQITACWRVAFHQQQRETCTQHNQELCSQLTMRLSISPVCCKQRIECIEW
jgi:hypothetical protein